MARSKRVATEPPFRANPMMVVVVNNALTDTTSSGLESVVCNATVHAWFEAHVDAEDLVKPVSPGVSSAAAHIIEDFYPMPPFPTVEAARAIIDETMRLFGDDRIAVAAVAHAAALAWKQGYAEGLVCHGCSFRGREPGVARELRAGKARVEIVVPEAVKQRSIAAFLALLASPESPSKPRRSKKSTATRAPKRRPRGSST